MRLLLSIFGLSISPIMSRTRRHVVLAFGLVGFCVCSHAQAPAMPDDACEKLATLKLPNTTITMTEVVAAGEFKMPQQQGGPAPGTIGVGQPGTPGGQRPDGSRGGGAQAGGPGGAPGGGGPGGGGPGGGKPPVVDRAFCRVAATLKPSSDSDIKMEVWLPTSGWNQKFEAPGNAGFGGSLQYRGMIEGLTSGYAVASNDTGHDENNGTFIPGHPEKFIDYGYRADHEMTLRAKEFIKAYYGSDPVHSYWYGCSLGGMEALVEADRYPADYDGIVAGSPMNPMTMFNAAQMWPSWLSYKYPDAVIPKAKFGVMHEAIMKACATAVGQKQGYIEDPGSCTWDPAVLLCKNGDAPDCLTAAQVDMAHKYYQGPVNPRTGELIFPGPPLGFEADSASKGMEHQIPVAIDLYKYAVYKDPNWDWKTMDFDTAITKAHKEVDPIMRAGTHLNAFLDRGGKLMMYNGWAEWRNGIEMRQYYQDVVKNDPAKADQVRLFLVPGMGHCGGGAGADTFAKLSTMDQWVSTGKAPDEILSSKMAQGKIVFTRPLCADPAVARYKGTGDINDAANFSCVK